MPITSNLTNSQFLQDPQSLGKAINRAARKLPYSPRKKAAVVKGLAKRAGFKTDEKTTPRASGEAI